MFNIYIDTALLAVPNYATDDKAAEIIFERLAHFSQLSLPEIPVNIVVSETAEELLWSASCGPDFDTLNESIALMQIEQFFSAKDLLRLYQTILSHASRSDSNPVEVKEISGFTSIPEMPPGLTPSNLQGESMRVIAAVTVLSELCPPWLFGSAFDDMEEEFLSVNVSVDVVGGVDPSLIGSLPKEMSGRATPFTHIEQLINERCAFDFWQSATSDAEIYLAIVLGALNLLRQEGRNATLKSLAQFRVGSNFRESLEANKCGGNNQFSSTTFSTCAQIVAQRCNRRAAAFGKPAQSCRASDKALAQRMHITKGSEAMRLMFWDINGELEFANVGVKQELKIAYGNPAECTSLDLTRIFA